MERRQHRPALAPAVCLAPAHLQDCWQPLGLRALVGAGKLRDKQSTARNTGQSSGQAAKASVQICCHLEHAGQVRGGHRSGPLSCTAPGGMSARVRGERPCRGFHQDHLQSPSRRGFSYSEREREGWERSSGASLCSILPGALQEGLLTRSCNGRTRVSGFELAGGRSALHCFPHCMLLLCSRVLGEGDIPCAKLQSGRGHWDAF